MTEPTPTVPEPGTPTNPREPMAFESEFRRLATSGGTGPVVISQLTATPVEPLAQGGVWAPGLVITMGQGVVNLNFRFPDVNAMLPYGSNVLFNAETATATVWAGDRFGLRVQVHQAAFQFTRGVGPALIEHSASAEISLTPGRAGAWTLSVGASGWYGHATDQNPVSYSMGELHIECALPLTTPVPVAT